MNRNTCITIYHIAINDTASAGNVKNDQSILSILSILGFNTHLYLGTCISITKYYYALWRAVGANQ